MVDAFKTYAPETFDLVSQAVHGASSDLGFLRLAEEPWSKLKDISIDYAIMENARNIVCADGVFGWDDLGSWPALARHVRADKAGNSSVADLVQIDSADNVIFDARTRNRTPIALVGMSETIVVQTDDATMVAAKSESQKIKQLVALLANDKRFAHLV